jgi:GAF domain-containing protein
MAMGLSESLRQVEAAQVEGLAGVVDAIIEQAAALLESPISYFALTNSDCSLLIMIGWSKTVMRNCAMIDKPIVYAIEKTGLWCDSVREGRPVVINDYASLVKSTKRGYPTGHVDVQRHVNVCMMSDGQIKGVLGVGNKVAPYEDADVALLQEFVNEAQKYLPVAEVAAIVG